MSSAQENLTLYPLTAPFRETKLDVGSGHEIHVEEHGNPKGKPVVFVHGGPGGGIDASCARYFNPELWHVILFDQRGCGKSQPFSSIADNSTWDLVSDMEKIREKFQIEKWTVFGGSWGSTLALAYGIKHPERCFEFILRGIFLGRNKDIEWLYQKGADNIFPDAWEHFLKPIAPENRMTMVKSYYEALTSDNKKVQLEAAKAWSVWEGSICQLLPQQSTIDRFRVDDFSLAFARIECHYFINHCFFKTDNYLLENIHKLENIPGYITQGRYDIVCPPTQAWELHKAWKGSTIEFAPLAGHSLSEPGITNQVLTWTDLLGK